MKSVLFLASVAAAKNVRLTSYIGASTDPCGGAVKGTFYVEEGACYQLSKVPQSSQNVDQKITCEPNGKVTVFSFVSKDGSCTQQSEATTTVKKGECLGAPYPAPGIKFECDLPSIVELAESVANLSTLVAAVVAGDLVDTLSASEPLTVFAPTNEAFAALPTGVLDDLMKPESKAKLVDILTNHVTAESGCPSRDVAGECNLKALGGKTLEYYCLQATCVVRLCDGPCSYEACNCGPSQTVIGTDTASNGFITVIGTDTASNGVINIVDGVLLSPTSPTSATIV